MKYKIRKMFWCFTLIMCIVSLLLGISDSPSFAVGEGALPEPIVTGQSVEICLNSRDSEGMLNPGAVTDQQISNILWGAGMAPLIGSYRTIYLTTTNGTYLYNPTTHSLSWYSSTNITGEGAFAIVKEAELVFDAGLIYMPALLASVSLWYSDELKVASRPIGVNIVFGTEQDVHGLDTELAAICSVPESDPGYLPAPSTNGTNSLEGVLADLNYTDNFTETDLTLQQISQLLWAGYGCTPHTGTGGKYALTVPSAAANYYLTKRIYLVSENGTYRYHNRLPPGDNLTSSDHRLEQTVSGDVRANLRDDVTGLPQAPCYVILCLDEGQVGNWYVDPEPSFVAFNMLMQATALDLGAHFKTGLTSGEQSDVRTTANITSTDVPLVVVSLGYNNQMHALTSYQDATHTTTCDNFTDYSTEHIAYMYGTNLTANHDYRVVYYDGSDTKIATDGVTSGASGNLSSLHEFDIGEDVGTWNVIVCEPYFTPSASYNGTWAYAIVSDSFIVQQTAIPEFPTVIAAIVAFSLCVGIYLWIRRKAVSAPVKSTL